MEATLKWTAWVVCGNETKIRFRVAIPEAPSEKEVSFTAVLMWLGLGIPIVHTGVNGIFLKVLTLWL